MLWACFDFHTDTSDIVEKDSAPVEHMKVEVDQNENIALETLEEEEGGESMEENIESIQCTPDISVYPEKGEPFPIEMVNCENDDINACL